MARSHDFGVDRRVDVRGAALADQALDLGPDALADRLVQGIKAETIDCGVFGVFALEIFRAKGIEAFPGQVLRTYAEESTTHWRHKWASLPGAFDWIGGRVVYHEICVVRVNGNQARVYDPTDGVWLDPGFTAGTAATSRSAPNCRWR